MDQAVINANMDALLKAQQGELDAILMYNKLAEIVSERDAAVFRQLAAEEGRHASVFHNYTRKTLEPKKTKSVLVPFLYRTIGREKTYQLISSQEYSAGEKYITLLNTFADVQEVRDDEFRHGDMVKALLQP
ncbi:MAG: rubrerythrin [Oscillospiraceae bacterium]|nr:rubrerythrin [Oscillospiraceae bacterium]